jgi:hypothetical protein
LNFLRNNDSRPNKEIISFFVAIAGQPSWGIAWYIDDLLIPEIYVERGETYTFLVEGGRKAELIN